MSYIILTDSGCDLTQEQLKSLNIECVNLTVKISGCDKEIYNITDEEMKEFYSYLRSQVSVNTSAVSVGAFYDKMKNILDSGNDILYLGFDSSLSCTYHNACIAAKDLIPQYLDRKIYTVNTLCASLGLGLLVSLVAEKQLLGADIDEARKFAEESANKICHWFTVEDLNFLKRGGRISSAVAAVGTMLNIKPILHNDKNGYLVSTGKTHGRRKALSTLVDKVRQGAINVESQYIMICHGDCREDAEWIRDQLILQLGVSKVDIGYIGPVIAAHAGPGTLSVFYIGNNR